VLGALFASEFLAGVGVMVLDISAGVMFAAVIPHQLRSRVTGAFQAVNYGTRPIGSLVAGVLGTAIGVRPTLWIASIGGCTAFLSLLPSPVPRFRQLADASGAAGTPHVTVNSGLSGPDQ
jgi:MFS family permease